MRDLRAGGDCGDGTGRLSVNGGTGVGRGGGVDVDGGGLVGAVVRDVLTRSATVRDVGSLGRARVGVYGVGRILPGVVDVVGRVDTTTIFPFGDIDLTLDGLVVGRFVLKTDRGFTVAGSMLEEVIEVYDGYMVDIWKDKMEGEDGRIR